MMSTNAPETPQQALHLHSITRKSFLDDISINSSLLSPPIATQSDGDIPFKPSKFDTRSLSMRKGYSVRCHYRKCDYPSRVSTMSSYGVSEVLGGWSHNLSSSRSMPSLRFYTSHDLNQQRFIPGSGPSKFDVKHLHRRWTLPAKAPPTKCLTNLKPQVRQTSHSIRKRKKLSPAMITLRRATAKSPRKTSLTFFPTPNFSRSRSSLMSYFSGNTTSINCSTIKGEGYYGEQAPSSRRDRSLSIATDAAFPASGELASPLLTDARPRPYFADVGLQNSLRRCSMRYTPGASIHEVLWDENDTPSSESRSSPSAQTPDNSISRSRAVSQSKRGSVAMDKLESQLLDDPFNKHHSLTAGSRRYSDVEQMFWQRRLSVKVSRFINQMALQDLPRSRASKNSQTLQPSLQSDSDPDHQTIIDLWAWNPKSVEIFPPAQIWSRNNSILASINKDSLSEATLTTCTPASEVEILEPRSASIENGTCCGEGTPEEMKRVKRSQIPYSRPRSMQRPTSDYGDKTPLLAFAS